MLLEKKTHFVGKDCIFLNLNNITLKKHLLPSLPPFPPPTPNKHLSFCPWGVTPCLPSQIMVTGCVAQ